ncbi:MAG: BON domain-containing protein [Bdellovibrionota bacterium]
MRDQDEDYVRSDVTPIYEFRNLTLKEEVGEALAFLEDTDASRVEVDARDGVITLYGIVETQREKEAAADCASEVDGVITVINQIEISH